MATQTLEFNSTPGLTITAKLFAVGSDTVTASVSATEKTNHKGRYSAAFTDIAAGAYALAGFVSGTGGFANEVYDLTLATATFYPRSESFSNVTIQTDLIGTGAVAITSPVADDGSITQIVIADDYLDANARAFEFTVAAPAGFVLGTSTCTFGGKAAARSTSYTWSVDGTITDAGSGNWLLTFDLTRDDTAALPPGPYKWSVSVRDASSNKITKVISDADTMLVESQS